MKSPHEKDFKKLSIRKSKADLAYKHEQSFYRVAECPLHLELAQPLLCSSKYCMPYPSATDQGPRYTLICNLPEVFEIPSDPHQRKKFLTLITECKKLPNAPKQHGCPSGISPSPLCNTISSR